MRTEGKLIKDPLGRTVAVRGLTKMCMEFKTYYEVPSYNITESDFETIHNKLHPVVVGIDLALSLLFPTFNVAQPDALYLEHMDNIVRWCRQRGMYVLFNLHGYYTQTFFPADFWLGTHGGVNQPYRNQIRDFWCFIADRYKGDATVFGFDLVNEPWNCVSGADRPYPDEWKIQNEEWIDAIAAVNSKLLFFVENASHQAWGFDDWRWLRTAPVDRANVVYSPHFYPQNGDGTWKSQWIPLPGNTFADDYAAGNYVVAKENMKKYLTELWMLDLPYPMHIGEFGFSNNESGVQCLTDLLDIIHTYFGYNYNYWAWVGRPQPSYALVEEDWVTLTPQGEALAEFLPTPTPPIDLPTISGIALAITDVLLIGYYIYTHVKVSN